jgi:hypothetical protein
MVTATNIPYRNRDVNNWIVDESHETYALVRTTIMVIMPLVSQNQVRRFRFPLMLIYGDERRIEYCQLRAVNVDDQVLIEIVRI